MGAGGPGIFFSSFFHFFGPPGRGGFFRKKPGFPPRKRPGNRKKGGNFYRFSPDFWRQAPQLLPISNCLARKIVFDKEVRRFLAPFFAPGGHFFGPPGPRAFPGPPGEKKATFSRFLGFPEKGRFRAPGALFFGNSSRNFFPRYLKKWPRKGGCGPCGSRAPFL